jgi:hypothetical protein
MLVLGGGDFRFELKFRCFLSQRTNLRATKLQLQLTVNLRTKFKAIMISYVNLSYVQ